MLQLLIILLLGSLTIFPSTALWAAIVDRIVAQVNNEIITLSELEQAMKYFQALEPGNPAARSSEAFRRQVLEMLIDRKLAKEEAKRLGITASDKEINQNLEDIKRRNGFANDEALAKALAKEGMTLEQLRQQIAEQIQQDRLMYATVKGKVKVSEADIRRFYELHYREADNRLRIKVLNLPFPPRADADQQEKVRQLAERLLEAARRGENFDRLLQEYNQPMAGVPGGDLGYVRQTDVDPQFFAFLARLRPGEVAAVRTPHGFQLIKLVDARIGKAKTLEEARPEIERLLERSELQKAFSEYLKGVRQKALIKIML